MAEVVAAIDAIPRIVNTTAAIGGAVMQGVVAGRDTKIGRYTTDYKSDIKAANREAIASAASYIYMNPTDTNHRLAQGYIDKHMSGYQIDRGMSDGEHIVLRNDTERKAIVAFRGTDAGTLADLDADVSLALHGSDYSGIPRFDRALSRFEQARRELDGYDLSVTGHSLGGSQAMWVARNNPGVKAKVFNPGITGPTGKQVLKSEFRNVTGNLLGKRDKYEGSEYNNIDIIRMDGDIVSSGYVSRVGFETTMADGKQVSDTGHLIRPYAHNGANLVNAKYSNTKDHGLSWTLKAHALQNFLTEDQAIEFRDLARLGKGTYVYGDKDGNSTTGNVHFQPAETKAESHTQMTGKMRTGNAYHHHVHTASLDI